MGLDRSVNRRSLPAPSNAQAAKAVNSRRCCGKSGRPQSNADSKQQAKPTLTRTSAKSNANCGRPSHMQIPTATSDSGQLARLAMKSRRGLFKNHPSQGDSSRGTSGFRARQPRVRPTLAFPTTDAFADATFMQSPLAMHTSTACTMAAGNPSPHAKPKATGLPPGGLMKSLLFQAVDVLSTPVRLNAFQPRRHPLPCRDVPTRFCPRLSQPGLPHTAGDERMDRHFPASGFRHVTAAINLPAHSPLNRSALMTAMRSLNPPDAGLRLPAPESLFELPELDQFG